MKACCPCEDRRKVLIVDDNLFNLLTLESIIEAAYFLKSDKASNGSEAVAKVAERKLDCLMDPCTCGANLSTYSLILMDCNMPVMDGFEATTKICAMYPSSDDKPYIVALTAYNTEATKQRCLAVGMQEFLAKPVEPASLGILFTKINLIL